MSEENEILKEKDEKNKKISDKKDDNKNEKDKNKIYEEELKNLLYEENEDKTIISTNEVEDSLIINEKIKKIRNMKLDSDELLKKNKYEEAIIKYKDTINTLLEDFNDKNSNMYLFENLKGEIIIPCYQNIALCHLKLKNWLKMKTYSKKVLELDKDNIKANCRLCLANIKLGHLKKADHQLEELEKRIGGSPELEDLEKIYAKNKLNAEGNNDELLKKMGKKLTDGKINMYSDKKMNIKIENKEKTSKFECFNKIKNYFLNCCKKKKIR